MKKSRQQGYNLNWDLNSKYDNPTRLSMFMILIFVFFLINMNIFSNETSIIDRINDYRIKQGLSDLVLEENLNITAQKYANELILEGRLNHVDKNDDRVLNRYRLSGGTAVEAGEILGTSTDIAQIFEAWKNSPSHSTLMSNDKWLRIGSSIVENEGSLVAVVLFSISPIKALNIEDSDGSVLVSIRSIKNLELHFPSGINAEKIETDLNDPELYRFLIPSVELPKLIPVSMKIDGKKKMSDFIYIR